LESYDGKLLKEKLNRVKIGNKISILRTDIPEKPILVRVDKMRENTSAPLILSHEGEKVAYKKEMVKRKMSTYKCF
jgi:hypothetical protein